MQLAHIYYYTYLMDNFSQVARKMCLMGFFQAGRAKVSRARASLEGVEDGAMVDFCGMIGRESP
jgi:hypothetical protein